MGSPARANHTGDVTTSHPAADEARTCSRTNRGTGNAAGIGHEISSVSPSVPEGTLMSDLKQSGYAYAETRNMKAAPHRRHRERLSVPRSPDAAAWK